MNFVITNTAKNFFKIVFLSEWKILRNPEKWVGLELKKWNRKMRNNSYRGMRRGKIKEKKEGNKCEWFGSWIMSFVWRSVELKNVRKNWIMSVEVWITTLNVVWLFTYALSTSLRYFFNVRLKYSVLKVFFFLLNKNT